MARRTPLEGLAAASTHKRAPQVLGSRENHWLKQFRAALQRGEASEDGWIGLEGFRLVEEAFRSGLEVGALLVSASGEGHLDQLLQWLEPAASANPRPRFFRTSDRLFQGVSGTESPQGVAALVRPRTFQIDDLLRGVPLVLVLVGVQDPGNVGTVFRSAEAFGATGVVATAGTANPLAPKALRASAGSALRLPAITRAALPVILAQLRITGLQLLAASALVVETDAERPALLPEKADLRRPTALLIGNEGAGLAPEVERSADARIRIPLAEPVDSLNAAVSASVLLYEAARQRGKLG